MKKFPCVGCGICCKKVGPLVKSERYKGQFPFQIKDDGSFEKLGDDGKCTVYNERPPICKVSHWYYMDGNSNRMTKKEFYKDNARQCNTWMKEEGYNEDQLIDVDNI